MPARQKSQLILGYGERLLQRLRALKWSQSELAIRARISRPTLHRALHQDELTGRVATKIAKVLGREFLAPAVEVSSIRAQKNKKLPTDISVESPPGITWFGRVIEAVREDIEISQEELAKEIGISVNTYRRLINGQSKPRVAWLEGMSEVFELSTPIPVTAVSAMVMPTDPIYVALGRQLKAWRQSAGLYLYESSEMIDESAFFVASLEVGHEECMTFLDDLASLYGTTSDVLFRAAQLSLDPNVSAHSNPESIDRILTFESAMKESNRRQQWRSNNSREDKSWDFELALKLEQLRQSIGLSRAEAARRIGTTEEILTEWEDSRVEPTLDELQRMATVYRSTPWQLRYGGRWERAWKFPSAEESRAFIFSSVLAPKDLAWLYKFLAALAEYGLSEVELSDIRDSLLSPSHYGELESFVTIEERPAFVGARLRERAIEMWNNLRTPGWRDSKSTETWPTNCEIALEQVESDKQLLYEVRQRLSKGR